MEQLRNLIERNNGQTYPSKLLTVQRFHRESNFVTITELGAVNLQGFHSFVRSILLLRVT